MLLCHIPQLYFVCNHLIVIVVKLTCKLNVWISKDQTRKRHLVDRLELLHRSDHVLCLMESLSFSFISFTPEETPCGEIGLKN